MMSRLVILLVVVLCTLCIAFGQYSSVRPESERAEITEVRTPNLATAVPDALTDALNTTTETFYGTTVRVTYVEQPAMTLIGMAQAHVEIGGGKGIVAIIDTGIDPSHPALSQSLVPGYDFTRKTTFVSELLDLDPLSAASLTQSTVAFLDNFPAKLNQSTVAFLDQSTVAFLDNRLPVAFGHGTMVAGLVHLVAPTAKIMPLKVFRADGSANVADIVQAVYFAVDHGATVINMSFNLNAQSPDLSQAIAYAAHHKVICVASAGNMGNKVKLYPAGDRYVISVGSTNHLDKRSHFSNYGVAGVSTAAPGEALVTLFPGNHYAGVWGTSFSAALVSGGIALMESTRKPGSELDIKDALEHGHPIDQGMGDGRLDLITSLTYLSLPHPND
jgi:subtilisin family serine protease